MIPVYKHKYNNSEEIFKFLGEDDIKKIASCFRAKYKSGKRVKKCCRRVFKTTKKDIITLNLCPLSKKDKANVIWLSLIKENEIAAKDNDVNCLKWHKDFMHCYSIKCQEHRDRKRLAKELEEYVENSFKINF